jgi:carbon-monoxide dehydrogenase medium subunit
MYAFDYARPADQAAATSTASSDDVRYLAGGQSLVQAMKLRLASSEKLVDLGGIAGLKGIRREGDKLVIGGIGRGQGGHPRLGRSGRRHR